MSTYDNVLEQLDAWGEAYEIVPHAEVWTCETMAEYCGCTVREILKSVLLEDSEGTVWVYVLPGDEKVRSNALRRSLGVSRISFAKEERAEALCGCTIGCIPPFGHSTPLPILVHSGVFDSPYGYLSPGKHDCSLKMRSEALKRIEDARILE